MKFLLPLLSVFALASSLPTWHQGPIISDDDNLMERRDLYKVEVVQVRSSCYTKTIVAKITKYASGAQDYLAEAFKGAVADSNGDVMAISSSKKNIHVPFALGRITRHGHNRPGKHRISLLGFRNRLALLILAFAVVLTVACSYLRKKYVAASRQESDKASLELALSEKVLPGTSEKDIKIES
ncbi:hypothetical protein E4U54_001459 [Claviceps lovelessii]|nr:hypothetical protein E4U54_001459 [Claviceps lovelessii]